MVFYAIAVFFLTRYCIKIKKNPKYSVMGENYLQEQTAPMQFEEGLDFHGRRVAIIVVFLAAIVLSVVVPSGGNGGCRRSPRSTCPWLLWLWFSPA